jgi:hypothetical protein
MATNNFDPLKYGATIVNPTLPVENGAFDPLKYGAVPIKNEPSVLNKVGNTLLSPYQAMGELNVGGAKGVISTIKGIGNLGEKVLQQTVGRIPKVGEFLGLQPGTKTTAENLIPEKLTSPTNKLQEIGKTVEQVGEFMIPVGGEIKGASILSKILNMVKSGAEFASKNALQTGGDVKETTKSGVIGLVTPPAISGVTKLAQKALPGIGKAISGAIGLAIGKDPSIIERAFKNPNVVIQGMKDKLIPLDVREKAIKTLGDFENKFSNEFSSKLVKLQDSFNSSLSEKITKFQQKTYPNVWESGISKIKNKVIGEVQDITNGIPRIFRDMKVGVIDKGKKLIFDRSSIVKSGEQSNLQAVLDTINNQKDFSPDGVQGVAARINALSKFTEGAKEESSAIIARIHNLYGKVIEKTYPELGKIRKEYSDAKQMWSSINDILKSERVNPTAVTSATKKLSNLFNEDNEAYLRALQDLEKLTGTDLISQLASTEFKYLMPKTFGSKISQLGIIGGGYMITHNPITLLLLPLFSPRFEGKLVTTAGKILPGLIKNTPNAIRQVIKSLPPLIRNK